jgi:YidC/Oxa1 family membrane protein insertase
MFAGPGLKGKIDVFKPGEHAGPYRWVGIDNRYFLAAALPAGEEFGPATSAAPPQILLKARSVEIAPGGERVWEIPYFLGAKSHIRLSRYQLGLERSIDFGFFAQLGRFVLRILYWLHGFIGNWGWSIVILTVLIQTVLFPLTYKSMKAMAAMKKLQPDIARLQQKYAKDPSRLNAETMELYKKSGANPMGGCLPMLLQMPVFIALFNSLRNSWELHGASWMFWVRDLSAKDPYYVLPIIMGAVMFLQNRMNPAATSDPTQKTMMTWMPVIFTFIFISTPAGLVLYWLTSSIISAGIQLALKDHFAQA